MSDAARPSSWAIRQPGPPTIAIAAADGKRLLTLTIEASGTLTAAYDDADLDEAARIFVREVVRIAASLRPAQSDPVLARALVNYERKVLVDVLVYHYRADFRGCGCGWAELGRSWAEHVATVYEESVAARAADPPRQDGPS